MFALSSPWDQGTESSVQQLIVAGIKIWRNMFVEMCSGVKGIVRTDETDIPLCIGWRTEALSILQQFFLETKDKNAWNTPSTKE